MSTTKITVQVTINADVKKTWDYYTNPKHIIKWNFADPSWHCPNAENDMRIGGTYKARMEAKDGSFGFDFWGIYNDIKPNEKVGISLGDDRKWDTYFSVVDGGVKVIEEFEAENENPVEMQQEGWQMILNNFKKYVESL